MMRKILLLTALSLAALLPIAAQQATTVATENKTASDAQLRRQSFEKVWNTINEKHFDPTFGGVDWRKLREIYEPKAESAKTDDELHAVLRQMLGELKLSHFGIYPRAALDQMNQFGGGVIGIDLKMIDGQPVVSRVESGSTAEKAGLKTGFIIKRVDGKTVGELLAPLEKYLAERVSNDRLKNVYRERTLVNLIDGKPESVVKIEALGGDDQPQMFNVRRYAVKNEMSEALGNFPPQKVAFEAKRLGGDIGYIRFNIWVMPQMAKIRAAVRDFSDAKGIIFDLRGNPGGIGGMALGVAGLLTDERTSLGSMTGRVSEQKFIVYPQTNPFAGEIIILSDYGTGSTSEIFAAGLQEIGRAKIIGEQSAGAVLPSVFDTLPTGAIFQYAISDYKSPKNILIEGRGVTPDREVRQTRQSLLDGRDLPLEAALKTILE